MEVSLPECGKSGPPKSFTCCGLCVWPWKAPCSGPQILLGRSHAARLRYPPVVLCDRVVDACDCSRLSIRKLFPELPKPGAAGGEPAIFLPLQLWTETILFTQWPEHSSSLFSSHSSVTLNSPLIPSWVTRPTSLNYEENKSSLLFLFLACTLRQGCAVIGWEALMCFSIQIRLGSFLEWQKVGLAHSLCQLAY